MATWDEIKQLASDLRRVQYSTRPQRLTGRNCVDIISKLSQLGLIEVYRTCDGQSFLTTEEVSKEIYELLEDNNGRVSLQYLQETIGVDLIIIEGTVAKLTQQDCQVELHNKQLINSEFERRLIVNVTELVNENGFMTLVDLSQLYELSIHYLSKILHNRLDDCSSVFLDDNVVFGNSYVKTIKARMCGYFSAAVRPVVLSSCIAHLKVSEQLFIKLLNGLITSNRISGSLVSGNMSFVPSIYSRAQNKWIINLFNEFHNVTYNCVQRFGVTNPKSYLQKLLPGGIHFSTCVVDQSIIDHLQAAIEDCVIHETWVDLTGELPSALSSMDINTIVGPILVKFPNSRLCADSIVLSGSCQLKCQSMFEPIMREKAMFIVDNKPDLVLQLLEGSSGDDSKKKRPESPLLRVRNTSGLKGSCDRSQKRKSSKSKYLSDKHSPSPSRGKGGLQMTGQDDHGLIPFLSLNEVELTLRKCLSDGAPDDLISELAHEFCQPLCKRFNVFLLTHLRSTGVLDDEHLKSKVEFDISSLLIRIRLFERGILLLDKDLQISLTRHLLQTDGAELVKRLLIYLVTTNDLQKSFDVQGLSDKLRSKLLLRLSKPVRESILDLENTLNAAQMEDFYACSDQISDLLGLRFRNNERKRERQISQEIASHYQTRLATGRLVPTEILISTCCLIFQGHSGWPLSLDSSCLRSLIDWLKQYITPEEFGFLTDYMDLSDETGEEAIGGDAIKHLRVLENKLVELGSSWKRRVRSISKETS